MFDNEDDGSIVKMHRVSMQFWMLLMIKILQHFKNDYRSKIDIIKKIDNKIVREWKIKSLYEQWGV